MSDPLTDAQIAEGLRLASEATPRPWAYSFRGYSIDVVQAGGEHIANLHDHDPSLLHKSREADAIYIAHAANHHEAALRELQALRREVEGLREENGILRLNADNLDCLD